MAQNHHYTVTIFIRHFNTLKEAKWNVKLLSPREVKFFDNEEILHFIGDTLISVTPINVDKHGNISFGKTRKVKVKTRKVR